MYFVYCGYLTADSDPFEGDPVYAMHEFATPGGVERFYKEFKDKTADSSYCSKVLFRVFKGNELSLKAMETVTFYHLEEGKK